MRRTRFDTAVCPVARTADLLGDWWTPLVLRELFMGRRRFGQIQDNLEISRGVLTQRLNRLETEGVLERVPYQRNPVRHDYVLTDKGLALWEVIAALWRFGEDWMFDDRAPVELIDGRTGEPVRAKVVDERTGQAVELRHTRIRTRLT